MLLVTKIGYPLREVGLSPGTFVGSKTGSFSQELRPSPDVSLATQNHIFQVGCSPGIFLANMSKHVF